MFSRLLLVAIAVTLVINSFGTNGNELSNSMGSNRKLNTYYYSYNYGGDSDSSDDDDSTTTYSGYLGYLYRWLYYNRYGSSNGYWWKYLRYFCRRGDDDDDTQDNTDTDTDTDTTDDEYDARRIVLRLNCGGLGTDDDCDSYEYVDENGDLWESDCGLSNSDGIFSTQNDIADTNDDEIFRTERFIGGGNDLVYTFNALENGRYFVRLFFAEIFFNSPGDRTFDIEIQSIIVEQTLDAVEEAGRDVALIKEYSGIEVNDNTMTIKFLKCDICANDPKVNGIEIYRV